MTNYLDGKIYVWPTRTGDLVIWNTHDNDAVCRALDLFIEINKCDDDLIIMRDMSCKMWLHPKDLHKESWYGLSKEEQNELGSLVPFTVLTY